jgi:hypothetical protein
MIRGRPGAHFSWVARSLPSPWGWMRCGCGCSWHLKRNGAQYMFTRMQYVMVQYTFTRTQYIMEVLQPPGRSYGSSYSASYVYTNAICTLLIRWFIRCFIPLHLSYKFTLSDSWCTLLIWWFIRCFIRLHLSYKFTLSNSRCTRVRVLWVRQILRIIKYCYRWAWNMEGNQLWQEIKCAKERWHRLWFLSSLPFVKIKIYFLYIEEGQCYLIKLTVLQNWENSDAWHPYDTVPMRLDYGMSVQRLSWSP